MRNFKAVSAILTGHWLIEPAWATNHLPLIEALLKGENVQLPGRTQTSEKDDQNAEENPRRVCVISAKTYEASYWDGFKNAPEGSIAVHHIVGPVLKYGDGCGGLGTSDMSALLDQAEETPNIIGHLFKFDTPGGQVDGTGSYADNIKSKKKPKVGIVTDGMMASAGMWLGSAVDELYATQKTDSIGSIGVYTTLVDYSGFYEQKGIKLIEVYADQSKDKNKPYKDALKGDVSGIKTDVNFVAAQFISVIKTNRKGKLNLEADNPFTGKLFNAEEALAVGLIDGIKTQGEALDRISVLSTNYKNDQKQMKLTTKWNSLVTMLGLTALVLGAEQEVNEENIQSLADATKKAQDDLAASAAQVLVLQQAKAKADGELVTATARISALETDKTTLTAEVERLNTSRAQGSTNPLLKGTDKLPTAGAAAEAEPLDDPNAEHNQLAYAALGIPVPTK